jgi:hypothetical protein
VDKVRGRQARQFRNPTQFLSWCCEELEKLGKKVLLLIWENACWHVSKEVNRWLVKHNRKVNKSGGQAGVRKVVSCLLPKQSPWLNAIEPEWVLTANGGSWSSTGCSVRMSSPTGYAGLLVVRITDTSSFHRRSLDHALGTARGQKIGAPFRTPPVGAMVGLAGLAMATSFFVMVRLVRTG